jgi:hypothetical protein
LLFAEQKNAADVIQHSDGSGLIMSHEGELMSLHYTTV